MQRILTLFAEKPHKAITTTLPFNSIGVEPTSYTQYVPQPFTAQEVGAEFRKIAFALEKENWNISTVKATVETRTSISRPATELVFTVVLDTEETKE